MKSLTKTGIRGTTRRRHRLCRLRRWQGLISMAAALPVLVTSFTLVTLALESSTRDFSTSRWGRQENQGVTGNRSPFPFS